MNDIISKLIKERREPTDEEVIEYITQTKSGHSYYTAREEIRKLLYGNIIPNGYYSWGDYYKSL